MLNLSLSLSLILDTFLFNEAEPNIARLSSCILNMLVSKRVLDCLILLFLFPSILNMFVFLDMGSLMITMK
jgi:hypothetical protein